MDPILKFRFLYALSWAVGSLMQELDGPNIRPEEAVWTLKLREGKAVPYPGNPGPVRDRFALVFDDFFGDLTRREREEALAELKRELFPR